MNITQTTSFWQNNASPSATLSTGSVLNTKPRVQQQNSSAKASTPKKPNEIRWALVGAFSTSIVASVIATIWLGYAVGTQRLKRWEGIHANIPIAALGGVLSGGAFGSLAARFTASVQASKQITNNAAN